MSDNLFKNFSIAVLEERIARTLGDLTQSQVKVEINDLVLSGAYHATATFTVQVHYINEAEDSPF